MTFQQFLEDKNITSEFSKEVINQVATIPQNILDREIAKRRDLRNLKIVTIDGDDAKDLDDAISIERLSNGNYYLGVHIADVSHYVKEGSPLDRSAYERGTSIYLINRVIPMLPKELSNGICSLNPKVNRLTLSIFMEIDKSGGVVKYDICESVINTVARMTYKNVTKILDGHPELHKKYAHLVDDFFLMRKLAKILENKRIKRGALMFDFPEPHIVLDDNDKPLEVGKYEITTSNKIIEEFMLIANETIAKHIQQLDIPLVYRVHENPEPDKIQRFAIMLKGLGFKLQRTKGEPLKPKALQDVTNKIKGKDCEIAINTILLRSLMKARYCNENLGHFGLAAKYYCHFTSPIRRYPDLVVHRIVKDWLHKRIDDKRKRHLDVFTHDAAKTSSESEILAMTAERSWNDFKMAEFMEDKIGEEFDCFISSVTSFGIFVQLDNLVEGLIKMGDLKDDYYIFDEVHYRLTGKRGGGQYSIGDKLRVKLVRVNTELAQIDFVPVEEPKKKERKEKADGEKPKKQSFKRKGHRKKGNRPK